MKDGKPSDTGPPEQRPSASTGRRRAATQRRGFVERAMAAQGHSGHGADSVRPHLRDQLRLKSLLPQPYPTPDQERERERERDVWKDDHHR